MIDESLAPADVIPSEPMMWQPAPHLLPVTTRLSSTSTPPARSKSRIVRIHRRVHQRTSRYHLARLVLSRSSMTMARPHQP
jgi:hypothetical protein